MDNIGDQFLRGLERIMEERQLKAAPLSKAAGLSDTFIRNLKEGKAASPKLNNAYKLAEALNLTIEEVVNYASEGRSNSITIAGKVGAGARVPVFDAYEKGDGPQVECPPGLSPNGVVAVEIEGDSMEPLYSEGDFLFYTRDTHNGVPEDVIGKRCVCEDVDGNGWVKLIKRGTEPGLYHLIALNPDAENQHDIALTWAAAVRLHWPADLARTP